MRRPLLSLASLLLAVSAPATAQKAAPRGTRQDAPATPDPAIWEMTFADDFSAAPAGTGPDLTKWTLHDPWGTARPRELQGYAPDARACAKQGYTDDLVPAIVGELPFAKIYSEVPRELIKLARELK